MIKLMLLLTQFMRRTHITSHFIFSLLQDAFVESLNGPYLFKSMFEDDPEAATLSCLPGMASLLQTYPFFTLIFFFASIYWSISNIL